MSWEVEKFTESNLNEWELFIRDFALNSTFLHTRKFLSHNDSNVLNDFSLLFKKSGKLRAVLPAVITLNEENNKILHSHSGLTYGGFLFNANVGIEDALIIVEMAIEYAKSNLFDEIIVRNPFRIFQKEFSDSSDYAMWYHGFKIKNREIEVAINIAPDYNTVIQKKYDNGTKYNIKKAYKTVTPEFTNDYQTFWLLLEKNLYEKHKLKPVHTIESISNLVHLMGNELIKLVAGFVNNEMVCGVVLFCFNKTAIHAQYIASDSDFQDHRPINAVLDYIIRWGNENGFKYFNLGTPNENSGYGLNKGLAHFKESFGGSSVLRETMTLKLK